MIDVLLNILVVVAIILGVCSTWACISLVREVNRDSKKG